MHYVLYFYDKVTNDPCLHSAHSPLYIDRDQLCLTRDINNNEYKWIILRDMKMQCIADKI